MNVFPTIGGIDVESYPDGICIVQWATDYGDEARISIPYLLIPHLLAAIKAEAESAGHSF